MLGHPSLTDGCLLRGEELSVTVLETTAKNGIGQKPYMYIFLISNTDTSCYVIVVPQNRDLFAQPFARWPPLPSVGLRS